MYLVSPLISLENVLTTPWLTVDHWYDFETRPNYPHVGFDGGNVAVSTDAGLTWNVVTPVDGYIDLGIPGLDQEPGFTGSSENWILSHFDLSSFNGQVITIRFRVGADLGTNKAGWYIAHIELDESIGIQDNTIDGIDGFYLGQNYPNPFNPVTNIDFQLPKHGQARLAIYNVNGQLVRTLLNSELNAGPHTISWDGANDAGEQVTSGIYLYELKTDDGKLSHRMVMLK